MVNSTIHYSSYVHHDVKIGDNVVIGPLCRIGLPPEYHCDDYLTLPRGKVVIGDNVIITGGVCVDSGRAGDTVIGDGCMLMSNVHIGHDCVLGERVTVAPGATVGGITKIGNDAWIGINAAIHQMSNIPAKVIIGAGAVLTKKHKGQLHEAQAYAGNPARHIGPNKKWL
jgi:UDP-N-acetylglucosamine acyltransferase